MKTLGVGIGLRRSHHKDFLNGLPQADWLEVISENFMSMGGHQEKILNKILENYPVICHGVELSLGSLDPLDPVYLNSLKKLLEKTKSPWFSDHLCFTSNNKVHFHDLIPTLRCAESVEIIAAKINQIQDKMKIPFALENISYYVESAHHQMSEPEFIQQIVKKTGCFILLDVNNVFVNSFNHQYNALEYIKALPLDQIIQIHLAGHFNRGDVLIDTHGDFVNQDVWNLYSETIKLLKRPVSTLIEWDNDVPEINVLESEVIKAKNILGSIL